MDMNRAGKEQAGGKITFEMSEEQSRAYSEWLDGVILQALEEDEIAPQVTVAFEMSSVSRRVVAYWGSSEAHAISKIVLGDDDA